jgi:hypothetical protein
MPQRQMLPFMKRTMSSSLGLGLKFSSPTVDKIIPEVQ